MTETHAPTEQTKLPLGFAQETCTTATRTFRYAESGDGEVLLVVHGGSGWAGNLSSLHSELATTYRVVAPELPGFGTTGGDGIDSLRDLAGALAEFASALGIDRCSVLGSSLGGGVALWLAIDRPELVDKLILDAPAAFREGAPPPGPPPQRSTDHAPETPPPGPPPEQLAFMRRILEPATDPDLVAAIPRCSVPTLALLAQDDAFFGTRYAADYKRLPRCTVAIVHRATHNLKESRPEAYLAVTRDFLSRGPGFMVAQKSTLIHA